MEHETAIRLGFFLGILAAMALWELAAARRELESGRARRWVANLGLVALDTAVVRLLAPITATGLAVVASERGWGLLHRFALPAWLAFLVAFLALDLVIYLQHVIFHAVPALWRLHMTHHSDLDFDATTGVRFHPLEILLSLAIKLAAILVLGPSPLAVVGFEVVLNGTSLFNHGNVRLPAALDRVLRWLVVTPDMHRVHHSAAAPETNSNFGFNFPWWDRLFGTYRAQPRLGHEAMTIGLDQFRDPARLALPRLLALPFVGRTGDYPINRREADEDREG